MNENTPRRLSAGIVVVHFDGVGYQYLLLRAYRYWDFPKGGVEPGETPLHAAQREVREETDLSELDFPLGDRHIETAPYAGGKIARYYLALSRTRKVALGINPTLGRAEHDEYRWLEYDAARKLVGPRVAKVLEWAHRVLEKNRVTD